jgi:S-adenosylmethionine-diacylglycerol 3-amino-3-carboxypropyl transferase
MTTEVAGKADFSGIRYAQCWEDADILLEGLDVQPGDVCVSIASAGDNSLALLTRRPRRVIALDLSPAQLACMALRVAAYRELSHGELLELLGSRISVRREELYRRCRSQLDSDVRAFWDDHREDIQQGIGGAGKFERYFRLFRRWVLPLVHRHATVDCLLAGGGSGDQRRAFYEQHWNTWRWRLLFRIFCSRFVLGRLGRDPSFFAYAHGSVSQHVLKRARHAAVALDPAQNPYLQWMLAGRHLTALPLALRPEHFETIRGHLDRLQWHCQSLEEYLGGPESEPVDRFNLSDIFEYMSPENYCRLLEQIVRHAKPGGRLAYWNMLVPRSRPDSMADCLVPQNELAERLFAQDKAFFYSRFVIEDVRGC